MAYCDEADYDDVFKLLADLLEYYELNCKGLYGENKFLQQYEKCRKIMDRELNFVIKLDTPAITCVNRDYIKDIAARSNMDVDNGEYDSAITKSRTLLEEVFCHAIENQGEIPSDKGDIGKLYNQVKTLYDIKE